MADRKISELTNLTGANLADDDEFPLVDTSADETKAITFGEFKTALDTATGFVRITGDTMTGNLSMGDNVKAIFGAGSDLQIYSDGTSGIIKDVGAGDIKILADDFYVQNAAGNSTLISVLDTGKVGLGFAGSEKLATTSTGIDVTGTLTSDGLTSSAVITAQEGRSNTAGTGQIVIDPDDTTVSAAFRLDQADNKLNIDMTNAGTWQKKLSVYTGGDISFYEDTGTTPKFFWDASEERLGIGTSSPSTRLTVGAGAGTEEIRVDAGAGWADLTLNSNSTNGGHIYFNDGSNAGEIFYYHASDYMAFNTAGAEAMRIDASGRVGIGITPAAVADNTGADSLQLGGTFLIHFDEDGPGTTTLGNNIYYNGTVNKALFAGATSQYYQAAGTHVWRNSGSTSAGSTVTMSEAMRIDSSGNLLVGKPSTAFGTDGTHINNSGYLEVTNTSGELLYLNRLSNDGDLIRLFKDSAPVGSIGTHASNITIGTGATGLRFYDTDNVIMPRNPSTGASVNGTISLGEPLNRFKDLHLSGSIEIENGTGNVGVGKQALNSNSANENTAVGYKAGYSQTSGGYYNTYMGYASGYSNTGGDFNTYYGYQSGYSNQGGTGNTYIGTQSGYLMSGGNYNTILGGYKGNSGGLDIRTASNNIVLSDGAGNPRLHIDNSGRTFFGPEPTAHAVLNTHSTGSLMAMNIYQLGNVDRIACKIRNDYAQSSQSATMIQFCSSNGTERGAIKTTGSSTSYNTSSDYRLKENVVELTGATTRLKQLEPKRFNFTADADTTVDGFLAHEVQTVVPEAITGTHNEVDADGNPVYQGIDQSKLVPLLVATIKELEARITALENA